MSFKISEDIEEENEGKSKKDNGKFNIIIIVVIAFVVFLVVFLILNGILNPKTKTKPKDPVVTEEKRSLTESTVKTLYEYVTYGANSDVRNDMYVKNKKVTIDDFTNEDKFYYALMFVEVKDLDYTGNMDANNNKIYSISNRKIKKYMERYFGSGVKYSTDIKISKYPFTFSINDKNLGNIKYNEETASFDMTLEKEEYKEEDTIINPYVGELVEAYKEPDGGYKLVEKLIYVDAKKQSDGKYEVTISRDYEHNSVITSSIDQTASDVKNIKLSKYKDKAATITYNFKLNGNVLYFYSSEIK